MKTGDEVIVWDDPKQTCRRIFLYEYKGLYYVTTNLNNIGLGGKTYTYSNCKLAPKEVSINIDGNDYSISSKYDVEEIKDILLIKLELDDVFRRGEEVMVRDDESRGWVKRIYLDSIGENHLCVSLGGEDSFRKGKRFGVNSWIFIKKLED